jgi:hypothetical protein
VIAASRRFLEEHPGASAEQVERVRRKLNVDLPARMDDRDHARAARAVAEAGADTAGARAAWQGYLAAHPKGRHADAVRGKLAALAVWKVRVVKARLAGEYREGVGSSAWSYRPTAAGSRVALLDVELEAASPDDRPVAERLRPGAGVLSQDGLDFLQGKGKVHDRFGRFILDDSKRRAGPWRLFLSNQADLVLPDGTRLQPEVTSSPGPFNYGSTALKGELTLHIGNPSQERAVVRFVRGPGITAALVRPGMKATVTLAYAVPAGTARASLRFADCPAVPLTLDR